MITAIVQYKLPSTISHADCERHFHKITENFQGVKGLHRKNFIWAGDGWAGGVYLWEDMASAKDFYSGTWADGIRARYGMDPVIRYFQTSGITDNEAVSPGIRRFSTAKVELASSEKNVSL